MLLLHRDQRIANKVSLSADATSQLNRCFQNVNLIFWHPKDQSEHGLRGMRLCNAMYDSSGRDGLYSKGIAINVSRCQGLMSLQQKNNTFERPCSAKFCSSFGLFPSRVWDSYCAFVFYPFLSRVETCSVPISCSSPWTSYLCPDLCPSPCLETAISPFNVTMRPSQNSASGFLCINFHC